MQKQRYPIKGKERESYLESIELNEFLAVGFLRERTESSMKYLYRVFEFRGFFSGNYDDNERNASAQNLLVNIRVTEIGNIFMNCPH